MRIRIQQEPELLKYYISGTLTTPEAMEFLQRKGYRIKSWLWKYEDETFPGGKTQHETQTFVALREAEEPSEDKIYTAVLEKEIRKLLTGCGLP